MRSPRSDRRPALAAAWLLVATCAGAGEVYRWTDAQGRVQFGDRPPAQAQAERLTLRINTYETPNIEALADALDVGRDVVMYSAAWCPVCRTAKAYFEAQGVPYTEYDVETSARGKRDFARLHGRGVPVILVGGQRLNGFSPASFERLYRPDD